MSGLFFQAWVALPFHPVLAELGAGSAGVGVRNLFLCTAAVNGELSDPAEPLRKELAAHQQEYEAMLGELATQDTAWRSTRPGADKARARVVRSQITHRANELRRRIQKERRGLCATEAGIGVGPGKNVAVRMNSDEAWLLRYLERRHKLVGRQILFRAIHTEPILDAAIAVADTPAASRGELLEAVLSDVLDRPDADEHPAI